MRELNEAGELLEMFQNADKLKTKLKYLIKKNKVTFKIAGCIYKCTERNQLQRYFTTLVAFGAQRIESGHTKAHSCSTTISSFLVASRPQHSFEQCEFREKS